MRNKEKDAVEMAIKRENMLQTAFRLFAERNIDSVTMAEIAKVAGYGNKTLHRYFNEKSVLVVAVATWGWKKYEEELKEKPADTIKRNQSGLEGFEAFLDLFLDLYKNHKDLLRFNQFFNIYFVSEKLDAEIMKPYQEYIIGLRNGFHIIYEKGQEDHTLRSDISEEEMFSTMLHLMLAAITRYAIGLVYKTNDESEELKELMHLKQMLMDNFRAK